MPIAIREATPRDGQALREFFLKARSQTFVWQTEGSFKLSDFDQQTEGEHLLVAETEAERLAGFISFQKPDDFIHHLFVERSHQRGGVGRALLQALPEWQARRRYRLKCLLANRTALSFYRACDFAEIGAGTSDDGDYLLLESHGDADARPSIDEQRSGVAS